MTAPGLRTLLPSIALVATACSFPYPGDYVPDAISTACGNGRLDLGESCDGDLNDGSTCMDLGHGGGSLSCASNCMYDVSACDNSTPSIPRLRLPMNDTYAGSIHLVDSMRPRFSWDPSTWEGQGTVDYELQLSSDKTFASSVTTVTTSVRNHRPVSDLPVHMSPPVGTRFYWRVRACVDTHCSSYSTAWWVNVGRSDRDLNGDGFADIAIGSYKGSGHAYIYFGGPGPALDTTSDGLIVGSGNESLGASVAITPDLNGDGFADLVVGAPTSNATAALAGRAYVYFGGTGLPFNTVVDGTLAGASAGDAFGSSVAPAGDVNGDGFSDVLVGSFPDGGRPGSASLFLGGPGAFDLSSDASLRGSEGGAEIFGSVLSSAGDLDGDGYSDVVVAAIARGAAAGHAYIFNGGEGPFDTVADSVLGANEADESFGESASSAGDMNGDGFADLAVGAWGASSRSVYLYHGGPSDVLDASFDARFLPVGIGSAFGRAVASAGDVNGDGLSDLIAGDSLADIGANADSGDAYVYFGSAQPTQDTEADGRLTGSEMSGDHFGWAVASAGDINADGFADVLVSAPNNGGTATGAGRVYAYFGASGTAFDAVENGTISGTVADENFGISIH